MDNNFIPYGEFVDGICNHQTEECCDSDFNCHHTNNSNNRSKDRRTITSIYLTLTENCNMACDYCFEKAKDKTKVMSQDVAFKAIDYAIENSKKVGCEADITFFGGEPLLAPKLITECLKYGYKKAESLDTKIRFAIITNGSIFNDDVKEMIDTWCKYDKPDIQLSYEGLDEFQDINRPMVNKNIKSSDAINNAFNNYKECITKNNKNFKNCLHIHACISKSNIGKVYDTYINIMETYKVPVNFAWVIEDDWDEDDEVVFDDQLSQIIVYLKNNKNSEKDFPIKHFDHVSGCSSGKNLVCVLTNGDIYPCHRFYFYSEENKKKFIYGNINDPDNILKYNEGIRKEIFDIDITKTEHDYPCQMCIACNYETTGDYIKRPSRHDEEFMKIINYHYNDYMKFLDVKNKFNALKNALENL